MVIIITNKRIFKNTHSGKRDDNHEDSRRRLVYQC